MNTLFIIIVVIILAEFALDKVLEYLNIKNLSPDIPAGAEGIYDAEKYKKSQEYYRTNHSFKMIRDFFNLALAMGVLFFSGYAIVDSFVRQYVENPILVALSFFGIFMVVFSIIAIPFSLYSTFVIEEKFGFNKTTGKTFLLDTIKSFFLTIVISAPLISLIMWTYQNTGEYFWLLAWGIVTVFSVFMNMFYTNLILPLFNKLTPLAEGELRTAIEEYCNKVNFKMSNVFVMDGSKRSSETNAFFSGLGGVKKVVLYDTLIEKHTTKEIVAIIAHEVGHSKHNHITKSLIKGILQMGAMFYILSFFLSNPALSEALGTQQSFHISIIVFGMLYSPVSQILGIISGIFSRKHEFEADAFAKETYSGDELCNALKKLSADNLSNLQPHPAYVFFNYSHPPLLERLKKLKD